MKQASAKRNALFYAAFAVYGIALLYILFLRSVGRHPAMTYTEYLHSMYNFIPLKSVYILLTTPIISASVVKRFLINFAGNILLFLPWGILLPLAFGKLRIYSSFLPVTLCTLLLIETVQLVTMLGVFDIEDILLNAIGASIGFVCCQKWVLTKSTQQKL